jgi:hypothetical protein
MAYKIKKKKEPKYVYKIEVSNGKYKEIERVKADNISSARYKAKKKFNDKMFFKKINRIG